MFDKMRLKRKVKTCKKKITDIEKKRARSQAALVEAILTNSVPDDKDVDFFNQFTQQIDAERELMHKYEAELKAL